MTECPCGSAQPLEACCGPYLDGAPAPTALSLMKSRYSAFVLGNGAYLGATLSQRQRADFDAEEFEKNAAETKWLGLEIRKVEAGGETDQTGTVEFVAKYREQKQPVVHHERATFIREDGKWVFDDCIMNPKEPQRIVAKVGRNDPCPCGSGKKYKKCCGA
ncbi:MAG: YchJ family protein [Rhodospirillales bacterium]|nr:YchJ family protein [Rhodospirillales bacterium]